ncbi:MAG: hypothetical protein AAGB22_15035 [Bacteroidota bacterium]
MTVASITFPGPGLLQSARHGPPGATLARMALMTYLDRLQKADRMIRMKATGTPRQLAKSLGIAPSSLFELIRLMKDLGGPIYYCRHRQSYCYRDAVRLEIAYRDS